jgi:hypothetical protein
MVTKIPSPVVSNGIQSLEKRYKPTTVMTITAMAWILGKSGIGIISIYNYISFYIQVQAQACKQSFLIIKL